MENEGYSFSKMFTNYVGLSMDARVVYTMERVRTPSACLNKILYALVGCFNFFRPLKELYKKISSFTDKCHLERSNLTELEPLELPKDYKDIANERAALNSSNIAIKKGYRGLVCLNCTSYMCGLRNVWSTDRIGSK